MSCEYIEPIHFDDVITIETTLTKLSRAQMVFSYRIVREDGVLMATGTSQNVFTHKATGQVARLDDAHYLPLKAFRDAEQAAQ